MNYLSLLGKLAYIISVIIILSSSIITRSYAISEVKLLPGFVPGDQRYYYPDLVLKEALRATVDSDGPFEITYAAEAMKRKRALSELIIGKLVNVHIAATQDAWERSTIPIRIPVLKGLLGYRLLLVHKDDLEMFKTLRDLNELKKLKAGSGSQWTTTAILQKLGFNVVPGTDYEGLFAMLNLHRFNYFPRGVNEIFHEFDSRKNTYQNIAIEPTKVLYFPTPSYFFISPKHPELADRLRRGLNIIIQNGVFDRLFEDYYGEVILRAQLTDRILFKLENPLLSPETPFNRPEVWFTP